MQWHLTKKALPLFRNSFRALESDIDLESVAQSNCADLTADKGADSVVILSAPPVPRADKEVILDKMTNAGAASTPLASGVFSNGSSLGSGVEVQSQHHSMSPHLSAGLGSIGTNDEDDDDILFRPGAGGFQADASTTAGANLNAQGQQPTTTTAGRGLGAGFSPVIYPRASVGGGSASYGYRHGSRDFAMHSEYGRTGGLRATVSPTPFHYRGDFARGTSNPPRVFHGSARRVPLQRKKTTFSMLRDLVGKVCGVCASEPTKGEQEPTERRGRKGERPSQAQAAVEVISGSRTSRARKLQVSAPHRATVTPGATGGETAAGPSLGVPPPLPPIPVLPPPVPAAATTKSILLDQTALTVQGQTPDTIRVDTVGRTGRIIWSGLNCDKMTKIERISAAAVVKREAGRAFGGGKVSVTLSQGSLIADFAAAKPAGPSALTTEELARMIMGRDGASSGLYAKPQLPKLAFRATTQHDAVLEIITSRQPIRKIKRAKQERLSWEGLQASGKVPEGVLNQLTTEMASHDFDDDPDYYGAILDEYVARLEAAWGITAQVRIDVLARELAVVRYPTGARDVGATLIAFIANFEAQFDLLMHERKVTGNTHFALDDLCGADMERKQFMNSLKYERGLPTWVVTKVDDYFGHRGEEVHQQSLKAALKRIRLVGVQDQSRGRTTQTTETGPGGNKLSGMQNYELEYPAAAGGHDQEQLLAPASTMQRTTTALPQHNQFTTTNMRTPGANQQQHQHGMQQCGGNHRAYHHIKFNRRVAAIERKRGVALEVGPCSFCMKHHKVTGDPADVLCPDQIASQDPRGTGGLKCNLACRPYEYRADLVEFAAPQGPPPPSGAGNQNQNPGGVLKKTVTFGEADAIEPPGWSIVRTMKSMRERQHPEYAYLQLNDAELATFFEGKKPVDPRHDWHTRKVEGNDRTPHVLAVHCGLALHKGFVLNREAMKSLVRFPAGIPSSLVESVTCAKGARVLKNDAVAAEIENLYPNKRTSAFGKTTGAKQKLPQAVVLIGDRVQKVLLDSACLVGPESEGQNLLAAELFAKLKATSPDAIRPENNRGNDVVQLGAASHLVPYRRNTAEILVTFRERAGKEKSVWIEFAVVDWLCAGDEVVIGLETYDELLGVLFEPKKVHLTKMKLSVPRYPDELPHDFHVASAPAEVSPKPEEDEKKKKSRKKKTDKVETAAKDKDDAPATTVEKKGEDAAAAKVTEAAGTVTTQS